MYYSMLDSVFPALKHVVIMLIILCLQFYVNFFIKQKPPDEAGGFTLLISGSVIIKVLVTEHIKVFPTTFFPDAADRYKLFNGDGVVPYRVVDRDTLHAAVGRVLTGGCF